MPTPRNQEGQKPTKGGKETARRLEEKARGQTGGSNKRRTETKAAQKKREG